MPITTIICTFKAFARPKSNLETTMASLTAVPWWHCQNFNSVNQAFVSKKSTQLIKCPYDTGNKLPVSRWLRPINRGGFYALVSRDILLPASWGILTSRSEIPWFLWSWNWKPFTRQQTFSLAATHDFVFKVQMLFLWAMEFQRHNESSFRRCYWPLCSLAFRRVLHQ